MSFSKIVLPLDGSRFAEQSLPHARLLAHAYGSRVLLLHILYTEAFAVEVCADSVDWRLHRLEMQAYLKRIADQLSCSGIQATYHVIDGRPAEQIIEFAHEHIADLIVLCAYGYGGVSQFPLGSTAQKVMSVPGSSYLVVRPQATPASTAQIGYRRILVPVDGSQRSEWAVGMAADLARTQNAELILLQVIQVPEILRRTPMSPEENALSSRFVEINRRAAEHNLADLRKHFSKDISLRTFLRVSPTISSVIQQIATDENVDLIALSAHGGTEPPISSSGSVCRSILAYGHLPVLVFQDQPRGIINQDLAHNEEDRSPRKAYGM
jgi:nucleotide-binding universal stress UspA family protein